MSNRTAESYKAVIEYIEENIFQLEPTSLMTDWELGMRKALKLCYPNCILRGCWFHYCSSLRKKCIKLGLDGLLKTNDYAKKISLQFMSLALLPKQHFETGLNHIKRLIPGYNLTPVFRSFLSYFTFWVRQVRVMSYHPYPSKLSGDGLKIYPYSTDVRSLSHSFFNFE